MLESLAREYGEISSIVAVGSAFCEESIRRSLRSCGVTLDENSDLEDSVDISFLTCLIRICLKEGLRLHRGAHPSVLMLISDNIEFAGAMQVCRRSHAFSGIILLYRREFLRSVVKKRVSSKSVQSRIQEAEAFVAAATHTMDWGKLLEHHGIPTSLPGEPEFGQESTGRHDYLQHYLAEQDRDEDEDDVEAARSAIRAASVVFSPQHQQQSSSGPVSSASSSVSSSARSLEQHHEFFPPTPSFGFPDSLWKPIEPLSTTPLFTGGSSGGGSPEQTQQQQQFPMGASRQRAATVSSATPSTEPYRPPPLRRASAISVPSTDWTRARPTTTPTTVPTVSGSSSSSTDSTATGSQTRSATTGGPRSSPVPRAVPADESPELSWAQKHQLQPGTSGGSGGVSLLSSRASHTDSDTFKMTSPGHRRTPSGLSYSSAVGSQSTSGTPRTPQPRLTTLEGVMPSASDRRVSAPPIVAGPGSPPLPFLSPAAARRAQSLTPFSKHLPPGKTGQPLQQLTPDKVRLQFQDVINYCRRERIIPREFFRTLVDDVILGRLYCFFFSVSSFCISPSLVAVAVVAVSDDAGESVIRRRLEHNLKIILAGRGDSRRLVSPHSAVSRGWRSPQAITGRMRSPQASRNPEAVEANFTFDQWIDMAVQEGVCKVEGLSNGWWRFLDFLCSGG